MIFKYIGIITTCILAIYILYKLYRRIFGYSYTSCPNDHDTMVRHGYRGICDKCGEDFSNFD